MKISTEIGSSTRIAGEERTIECVARAGFDAWDFSMHSTMCKYDWDTGNLLPNDHPLGGRDYLKFARRLKQIGLDNGIRCNQSHAPFPTENVEIRSYLKRAIECTAEAGGEICVIHPANDFSPCENAEIYWELLPFAKECGVKIATENMWNWDNIKDMASAAACSSPESFKTHIECVNDDFLIACVDIGHAEMKGLGTTAVDMIKYLGDKVQALHIHDNDRWHDSHQIPFSMDIDFEPIVRALKEINYSGYFTLEADRYLAEGGFNEENLVEGLTNMASAAKRLSNYFEKL